MTWFTSTGSPGATFHETISASVRPSPTSGSANFAVLIGVLLVVQGPVDRVQDTIRVGEVERLQLRGREGRVETRDPQHGGLQRVERTLRDGGGDLRADADVARR